MKKYLIEFIGTFFLVFVVAFTGNPIAIGVVLIALVYMGGHISGANYNPAVTLAIWLTKNMRFKQALGYMLVQMLGGISAAGMYFLLHGKNFVPQIGINVGWGSAFIIEFLFTFLLASVVLNVAVSQKTKGNDYFGLAIGLTLMAAAFVGGSISGGAFNPAVGAGPILYDFAHLNANMGSLLLYLIGPFAGGAVASLVYKLK
jgi:aquaporin Z